MIDRELIETFTAAILAEDLSPIAPHFTQHAMAAPLLTWDPAPSAILDPQLSLLYGWWLGQRTPERFPHIDSIDPFALKQALGYLVILDVLEDGWDYRYRLYGSVIAERAKRDHTGMRTSELHAVTPIPCFYIGCYRAILARQQPMLTFNEAPLDVATASWRRLILPLSDDSGTITRFLVGIMPGPWRMARALEPEPEPHP